MLTFHGVYAVVSDNILKCLHVDSIGLNGPAKDVEIWNYALFNNLIIVTNDEDFLNFSNIKGFPPKSSVAENG